MPAYVFYFRKITQCPHLSFLSSNGHNRLKWSFSINLSRIIWNPWPCQILLILLVPLSAVLRESFSPSEAAPLKDKTSAANNKALSSQDHNFGEESSDVGDDDESIFCEATNLDTPPPAFLHNYSSIKEMHPKSFKMIIRKTPPKHNQKPLTPK